MSSIGVSANSFMAGGGGLGAMMRTHDWSQSPLGPSASWPQSLRSIVSLLLNSQFPMFLAWGEELGFLYNDAYAEILGEKHPAALGRRFHDIWSEIWDDIQPSIEQAMQGQSTYHANLPLTMNRKGFDEQTWFTFSYSPVRDESGEVAGMFCAVTETTEQVLANRHHAEEVERLRRLFQQAPGIIAVLKESDHVFEIANLAFLQLVGHRDVLGKTVRSALPELDAQGFIELLDRVYATGEPYVGHELPVQLQRHAEGPMEERFVNFIYQPTVDHRGKISGIFVEGSDVTDTVRAHHALQASENELKSADRRKDEFLAMLAHELRNPLAPIATAAELLKLGSLNERVVRTTSEVIARQVGHMIELVDDLLDVSRVTRGLVTLQQETLDLRDLLEDAVEQAQPLIQAKQQRFTAALPDQPCHVRGDRTRLIQVFSNIINNAAKYTPAGGHISLRVGNCESASERVEVAVEDDGIGMSPGLLPYIFDPFTQAERSPDRSQGGLGLGLALVKRLLELQGGTISAQSAGAGLGSRFTVSLPRAIDALTPDRLHGPAPAEKAGHRILIVDDNRDAAQMLQLLLETEGQDVFIAHNGQDALAFAQQNSPDFLFLDIGLPDMDGLELARRLRALAQTALATLVAVSGYGQAQDRQRALEAGFDHYLVKPANLDDVLGLLRQVKR